MNVLTTRHDMIAFLRAHTSILPVRFSLKSVQMKLSLKTLVAFLLEKLWNHFVHEILGVVHLEVLTIGKP